MGWTPQPWNNGRRMGGRMSRRMPPALLCAGLALTLAACGTPLMAQHRQPAPVSDSAEVCDPDAVAGGVPDRFEPVLLALCDPILKIAPAPTMEPVLPELRDAPSRELSAPRAEPRADRPVHPRRFEGDLLPLLTALSTPDQPLTDGPCPAIMVYAPDVRLVDVDGRWIRAAVPLNECHQPIREPVDEAIARLTPVD